MGHVTALCYHLTNINQSLTGIPESSIPVSVAIAPPHSSALVIYELVQRVAFGIERDEVCPERLEGMPSEGNVFRQRLV